MIMTLSLFDSLVIGWDSGYRAIHCGPIQRPLCGNVDRGPGKSDFNPPRNFFRRMGVIGPQDNGISVIKKTINGQRQISQTGFTANCDGKGAAIENSPLNTVAVKRIDESDCGANRQAPQADGGKGNREGVGRWQGPGRFTTGFAEGQEYTSSQHFDRQ